MQRELINTIVTPTAPTATYTGPITRARARQLNYQVLLFLGNDSNVHENMMLPKLVMRTSIQLLHTQPLLLYILHQLLELVHAN